MDKHEELHKCPRCGLQYFATEELATFLSCPGCKRMAKFKLLDDPKIHELLSKRGDHSHKNNKG